MADAPPTRGGSILTRKWHGIPVPVLAVGGGVVLLLGYRWWKGRQSSSAASPTGNAAASGLGYPMGPSGVIGGGNGSTGQPVNVPPAMPPITVGAPPTDQTQPPTAPQSATVSTVPIPVFAGVNPTIPSEGLTAQAWQQTIANQTAANQAAGTTTAYPSTFVDTHGNFWPSYEAWKAAGSP